MSVHPHPGNPPGNNPTVFTVQGQQGVAVATYTHVQEHPGIVYTNQPVPQAPQVTYVQQPSQREPRSFCEECWRCDDDHNALSCAGKGAGWIILLILVWIILGAIGFVCLILACACGLFNQDEEVYEVRRIR